MWKRIALALAVTTFAAAPLAAQPQTQPSNPSQPAPPSDDGVTAEVKAAKGVENREPVEEGASFDAGTKVWCWSRIHNAAGTKVQHRWKRDGKQEWSATLKVGSRRWTTYSRRQVKPGSYQVEVVSEDGNVIGSVSFTVQ